MDFKRQKRSWQTRAQRLPLLMSPSLTNILLSLLHGCMNAMRLSQTLAEKWLRTYMFANEPNSSKPKEISDFFASHANTLSHNRAILIDQCIGLGLKVVDLRKRENRDQGEKLWELWCLYELHFERTPVHKMYENSSGCTLQKQTVQIQIAPRGPPVPSQPQQPVPQPPQPR